jgi:hypothetical protein
MFMLEEKDVCLTYRITQELQETTQCPQTESVERGLSPVAVTECTAMDDRPNLALKK